MLEEERIIDGRTASPNEENVDRALRPSLLNEYVGQEAIREQLQIFIAAAKRRGEPLDHLLLFGPPGLGKTTLAHIVAHEMGVNLRQTSGPVLERPGDLAAMLTNLEPHDILFIDEIHRMSPVVEEILYPALEDYQIDILIGEGPAARSVKLDLQPFTLIGATTRAGMLTNPLRDRFGVVARLEFYDIDDLTRIVARSAMLLKAPIVEDGAREIARRARGTPRIANRFLKRVRDFAEVIGDGIITGEIADLALSRLEIDELVYRADMATNYVLDEYCDGRPVAATSKIEAELGSGVTLYVGVEGGYGTTVVPRLVGFPLKEAKGRLWELGLNVGKVDFDEGINLLNQKDARVYIQHPTAERSAGLGSRVDLRLTLDEKKLAQHRAIAEKQAKEAAEERLQSEREHADSLAQAEFERAAAGTAEEQPADEPAAAGNDEGFFD